MNAILILLLLYGLARMKFTVGIRLDIFLENHELQLGVRLSSQVSMRVFLKRFLIRLLLYFQKQTNLKSDSNTDLYFQSERT